MSPIELVTQALRILGGKTKKSSSQANNCFLRLSLKQILEGFICEWAFMIAEWRKNSTQILILNGK
jgi:hypothetical protein